MNMDAEIPTWSVAKIARAIRTRQASSREVVTAFLERIEAVNGPLNAVVQLRAEAALEEADEADHLAVAGTTLGPLHGVPITVKDSFDTKGIVTTGGTSGRRSYVPESDATVVARLREAGAIVLGKTNTPELTFAYETDNLVYGRTVHPLDPERSPGGSSGGATAILAAGGSPLDIGSDTGGSIRIPSHFCGTAGLKPTAGAVPRTGHLVSYEGAFQSLTQIGPLGRYVDDLRVALPILEGPDAHDPHVVERPGARLPASDIAGLRIAFFTDNGVMAAHPHVSHGIRKAAEALEEAGAEVVADRPPRLAECLDLLYDLFGADGGAGVRAFLEGLGTEAPSPLIRDLLAMLEPRACSLEQFQQRLWSWDDWRSGMLGWLQDYDAVLCPPCAHLAPRHGTTNDPSSLPGFTHASAFNLTGWPAVVVGIGSSSDGLPVGAQIVCPPWRDHRCLDLARHLEDELGGWRPVGP